MIAQQETSWLDWLFQRETEQAGELRWQWMNLPESWGVFVWLLIIGIFVAGSIWLYRRESSVCPPRIRMLLAVMRVSVLLFLLLLLFKPAVYFQQVSIQRPTFVVLRDESMSSAKADRYEDNEATQKLATAAGIATEALKKGELTRGDIINRVMRQNEQATLNAIRDKGALQIIDFSDRLNPVATLPANDPLTNDSTDNQTDNQASTNSDPQGNTNNAELTDLVPQGLGTDIWLALRQVLNDTKRLAGIVLISEGQHNGSEDPVEMARRAMERDIPVFVVGIGDPTPERNLGVLQVNAATRGYLNEPFFVEAVLQASLPQEDPLRGSTVDVQLVEQKLDDRTGKPGDPVVLETQTVALPETGNRLRVQFSHVAQEQGRFVYSIKSSSVEGETNPDDNIGTSAVVEVVDEKIRVLLVSGLPNWDYQQLYRLLQRDATISVSCWLQSMDETRQQEGDEPIIQLPRTPEELGEYNVVILLDPNPEEFDEGWINMLKDFCRVKAGGLIYMAGPHYSAEFLSMNRLAGIRDILPVRLGNASEIAASQVLAGATGDVGGSMQVVNFNLEHEIMELGSTPESTQSIWAQMPGFAWNFPTQAPKPTARVLLERGDQPSTEGNQPMLVDGRFGAGTVLYFGFEGTWRWRQIGLQAQYFNSFWIQTVRYLVEHRSLQGNRRGYVDSDQIEYELGNDVLLLASVVDEQFRPLEQDNVDLVLADEDGRRQKVSMKKVPEQPGKYEATFKATRIGNFTAALDLASAESDQKLFEPATYRVTPPKIETSATWRNEKILRDLANQSGGAYLSIEEFSRLPELLPDLEKRIEFDSPPQPAWDLNRWMRGLAFLFPVVLLVAEWALRKWYKLL
ncbi:MAG: vWA domain-containing protein [Pirellulaceae bacterium]